MYTSFQTFRLIIFFYKSAIVIWFFYNWESKAFHIEAFTKIICLKVCYKFTKALQWSGIKVHFLLKIRQIWQFCSFYAWNYCLETLKFSNKRDAERIEKFFRFWNLKKSYTNKKKIKLGLLSFLPNNN